MEIYLLCSVMRDLRTLQSVSELKRTQIQKAVLSALLHTHTKKRIKE